MIGTAQFLLRVPPSARPTVHFVWVCRDQAAFFEWFPDMLLELLRCDDVELLLYHTARPVDATGAPAGTAPMGLSALSPPPTSPSLTPEAEAERSLSGSPKDDSAITVSSSATPPAYLLEAATAGPATPFELSMAVISGRPDWTAVFAPDTTHGANVAVLTCGPEALVVDVQRLAHAHRFHFHKETFLF
eukprot:EG_transcript_18748